MRLILVLLLALSLPPMFVDCGKKKQPPPPPPAATPLPTVEPTPEVTPTVQPTPVVDPSPSPVAPIVRATPHPTPDINPEVWFKPWNPGATVVVKAAEGEDLGALVNAADKKLTNGIIVIEGGGSIRTQIMLNNDSRWDSSTYSCDIPDITDYGCILMADNTRHEGTWRIHPVLIDYFKHGKGWDWKDPYLLKVQALTDEELAGTGTTILEPTYATKGGTPHISVFQAFGDSCCAHTDKADNIAIRGFHIKGRQKVYDGGVRSTILLGNCRNCTAQENYLEDTASIGIQAGGSALEWRRDKPDGSVETFSGNHAKNVLFWRNVTKGVAAANIASVNGEDIYMGENYARALGHKDEALPDGTKSPFGGGVCHIDFESNSTADHTGGIVWNNLSDYEGAPKSGNALCLQDPYQGVNHKPIRAINNVIIGGRMDNIWRYMTSGFFLNGLTNCHVSNNYVYRTGQNAIQMHSVKKCAIEDNDFESTGGGGNPSVWSTNSFDNIFRRNNYRERPGLSISVHPGFAEVCGGRNTYEGNQANGLELQPSKGCP